MANSIMIIYPYLYYGNWVFDDAAAGLVREPFVAGIPEMIDRLVDNILNAREGFKLFFSATQFLGHQSVLEWVKEDAGGNWYREVGRSEEGWLCPALFKYFDEAPKRIYVRAEGKAR
ncbi:hypothetical protein DEALK_15400 [Dehalogenimonas alkenigignens]|uniref:Uncharacterized protein n=1 Tax=Dehalogenimonas alkenigignens TaxID=1217799 RepID=A0A0W0GJF7_9CHLR|nr:DUF6717 family protein [Dehalogenimonas alkenigignens]KTB48693.1 hypothetical protein DEALK_15400 [Dehalogenimonas alkenigignens]